MTAPHCMRSDPSKRPPLQPGVAEARHHIRQRHQRELNRFKPETMSQRREAENALNSRTTANRKAAAITLGTLRYVESYQPLLSALARECQPDRQSREVEVAILEALHHIGHDHNTNEAIKAGREPIKKVILAHLGDTELVKTAFEALKWTALVTDICDDARAIKSRAESLQLRDTVRAASTFYLQLIER